MNTKVSKFKVLFCLLPSIRKNIATAPNAQHVFFANRRLFTLISKVYYAKKAPGSLRRFW